MKNQPEYDARSEDDILNALADATKTVADDVEQSEDHAIFVLGTKFTDTAEGESVVQTFLNVSGFLGILAEGLYQEIAEQVANGNMAMFSVIRDVVRDIEEDFEISPDAEFEDDGDGTTLH